MINQRLNDLDDSVLVVAYQESAERVATADAALGTLKPWDEPFLFAHGAAHTASNRHVPIAVEMQRRGLLRGVASVVLATAPALVNSPERAPSLPGDAPPKSEPSRGDS